MASGVQRPERAGWRERTNPWRSDQGRCDRDVHPQALAGLRAPVFENKVVDFVGELATTTDKPMTRAELAKLIAADDDEVPEEHHH